MNDYLIWHYQKIWKKLLIIESNLFLFPVFYFSIPLHLKTLISPWRRQIVAKKRGFRIDDVIGVISFNLTSRTLGLIIRTIVICYGLVLSVILPLIFLPVLIIWPLIPGLTYLIYISRPNPKDRLSEFLKIRLPDYPGSSKSDIDQCAVWFKKVENEQNDILLLSSKRIKSLTGIGTQWAYGYTVTLDKYSRDLTSSPTPYPFLLGRDKEMAYIERGLLKSENNNVLIIGEPGVGRHILISSFAHNLYLGKCDPYLAHKRILQLDMHALFADAPGVNELKALFSDLLYEAQHAGNIIIYIDDIDKYTATGQGRIDLTDVLSKFAQSRVGVIGVTTPDNYHTYIEPNDSLNKIFTEIKLNPPSLDEVLSELEISIVPVLERKYPVNITLSALKKVISDADRFLTSVPFPGKAIELLEETVIWKTENLKSENQKTSFLTSDDIDAYLSQKLNMPLGNMQKKESEILLDLENFLHQRVINQNQAIGLIAGSLRRARLNISSSNKPIGSFLFLGPTGVGKTETAKALNQAYFGKEKDLLRFDMSQYQGEEGLLRLIGSNVTASPGELTSKIREKPFGVLLFDEIEKAPPMILNLFLTLLDEGYISDGQGKKVDCKNTIIIATSNAGAEYIRENLVSGVTVSELSKTVVEYVLEQRIFSPEFVNRFDSTIVYTPLSEGQLKEVAKLMLNNLNERLKNQEISVAITPSLITHLANLGSNRQFGARSIRREIDTNIEDQIARKLLKGQIDKGKSIPIDIN